MHVYFTMNDAINCEIDADAPFIIANERPTKDGHIGRSFKVFESFEDFMELRENYTHSHEVLIDHVKIKPERSFGRLVFDFDIDKKYDGENFVPDGFKKQIEEIIYKTIDDYYHDIQIDKLKFVWSSSENPKKCSKHLTVKNFCFYDWLVQCKRFYKLFQKTWKDSPYTWISPEKLIDAQVVRRHGSLRMVGSSKIGGFVLNLDDPENCTFEDSLIRIYRPKVYNKEQIITQLNENDGLDDIMKEIDPRHKSEFEIIASVGTTYQLFDTPDAFGEDANPDNHPPEDFGESVNKLAVRMVNMLLPHTFEKGKINKNIIGLLRKKPGSPIICPISGFKHDKENSYLVINKYNDIIYVSYGCHRNCGLRKTMILGYFIWYKGKYLPTINQIFARRYSSFKKKNKKKKEDPLFLLKLNGTI